MEPYKVPKKNLVILCLFTRETYINTLIQIGKYRWINRLDGTRLMEKISPFFDLPLLSSY